MVGDSVFKTGFRKEAVKSSGQPNELHSEIESGLKSQLSCFLGICGQGALMICFGSHMEIAEKLFSWVVLSRVSISFRNTLLCALPQIQLFIWLGPGK